MVVRRMRPLCFILVFLLLIPLGLSVELQARESHRTFSENISLIDEDDPFIRSLIKLQRATRYQFNENFGFGLSFDNSVQLGFTIRFF